MTVTLEQSYADCRRLNKRYGTTYYLSTFALPRVKRHHVWALYAFCRYADDIVDAQAQRVRVVPVLVYTAMEFLEEAVEVDPRLPRCRAGVEEGVGQPRLAAAGRTVDVEPARARRASCPPVSLRNEDGESIDE